LLDIVGEALADLVVRTIVVDRVVVDKVVLLLAVAAAPETAQIHLHSLGLKGSISNFFMDFSPSASGRHTNQPSHRHANVHTDLLEITLLNPSINSNVDLVVPDSLHVDRRTDVLQVELLLVLLLELSPTHWSHGFS